MSKIKKIMDIPDIDIAVIDNTAIGIDICNIRHSSVHCHTNFITLVFCLEGSVRIRLNQELITLKPGMVHCTGLEDLHCVFSETDNITAMVYIDVRKINLPLDTIKSSCFVIDEDTLESYQTKPLRQIKNYLLAIIYTYIKNGTLNTSEADFMAHRVMDILMKYFDWNSNFNLSENIDYELRQRLRSVVKYCGINYMHKLTISQLAAILHINENYLSQFMQKSGYGSFSAMVGYYRCFYAQFLLLSSDLSIIQIADKVGFSDTKYFYKYFKAIWQKTPTEFRQWFIDYIQNEDSVYHYSNDEIFDVVKNYIVEDFSNSILQG